MSIPTTIESLSVTASSNGPAGTDDRSTADDGLRQAYAFIKQGVSLGSNIASSSTITPPSTGSVFNVTGTTSITTIASTNSWDGRIVTFIFAGALTLTHSSNLALPGSANITTVANDIATFVQTASGAWRCSAYSRVATGSFITGALTGITDLTTTGNTSLGNATADTLSVSGAVIKDGSGNWSIPSPSSGDTLTVNCPTSGTAIGVRSIGSSGVDGRIGIVDGQAGTREWYLSSGLGVVGSFVLYDATRAASVLRASSTGNVSILAPSSGYGLNIPTGTPASAAAAGSAGDIAWDASFIYVCTAANTWKRVAIATW